MPTDESNSDQPSPPADSTDDSTRQPGTTEDDELGTRVGTASEADDSDVSTTDREPAGNGEGEDGNADGGNDDGTGYGGDDGSGDRDVVVPMRVYKAVTMFTTLFAVVTVVGGFVLLDSATNRATAAVSEIQPLVALVGVGLIVAGAAAYAFSTRFRTAGMGKSKDDTDEPSNDG